MSKGTQLAVITPVKALVPADMNGTTEPYPDEKRRIINEFQSDSTELDTLPEPFLVRHFLWFLASVFVSLITWASFAEIDRLVTAQSKFISTASNVVLQPLEAAVIRSIEARVGDVVKAGVLLARLDPTFTQADVDQLEARIDSLDAVIARLEAEQKDVPYVPVKGGRYDYAALQFAIWQERRTQYAAQMRLFSERLARAETNLLSSRQELKFLNSRLVILRDVEAMRRELEEAKTGSRLNSLLAKDSRIEVERATTRAETTIVAAQHEMEGIEAERDVFKRQWESRTIEELVTKRNERDGMMEQLIKAQRRQDMVDMRSPVDAVVLEVAQRSVGSIIQAAEPLFRLVPLDAPLEVEAPVDAKDIGRIALNDDVQLKIEAAPFQEHGMMSGNVTFISPDSFIDTRPTPGGPAGAYYKVRISLRDIKMRNLPETFRLMPGMPVMVEIKVGKRTVMEYLLRPILRGMNESMREP
jgi:hemolysin D